jgi:DNA-binding NtrC family response regulator
VTPLGSTQPVKWDVRILAATNRNLKEGLRAGTFREDLYARLSASVVHLPALRERKEDVLLLAQHLAGHPLHLTPRIVAAMLRYDWPGNVREVDNIVSQFLDGDLSTVLRHLESFSVGSGVTSSGKQTSQISTQEITAPAPPSSASAPPVWHAGDPVPSQSEVLALLKEYQGSLRRIELRHGYPRRQFRRWVERYGIDLSQYRQASDS